MSGISLSLDCDDYEIILFHVRDGRDRALELARAEVEGLFSSLGLLEMMDGGPLTGQEKVFCVAFAEDTSHQKGFHTLCARLGYVDRVSLAREVLASSKGKNKGKARRSKSGKKSKAGNEETVWKGRMFVIEPLYEEDKEEMREKDPDQRVFLLQKANGVEAVKGYRGHGENFGRRALPVADCRLLVNLASRGLPCGDGGSSACGDEDCVLLDPFAGAGGVVIEARDAGFVVWSGDSDADLAPGLSALSTRHWVGSAVDLEGITEQSVDAIATEVPFEERCTADVIASFAEIARVLKRGRFVAVMSAVDQGDALEAAAGRHGFSLVLRQDVDRKGTEVTVFLFLNEGNERKGRPSR